MISKEDYNITVLFTPQWVPQNPHSALTCLAGHLRHNGYKVNLRDLNVEFYDKILRPEYIEKAKLKALKHYENLKMRVLMQCSLGRRDDDEINLDADKLLHFDNYFQNEQEAWNNVTELLNEAVSVLRDPERYFDPAALVHAFIIVDDALKIISLPYYPTKLCFNDFAHPTIPFNLAPIVEYCTTKKKNMFYKYYEEVLPEIIEAPPDILVFAIESSFQLLPGLTLAKMIKDRCPGIHINICGDFLGRVEDNLKKLPGFFENFCNSVITGESEKSVLELAEALRKGEDLKRVPSMLYLKDGEVKFTFRGHPELLDNLGIQDPGGLKLYKYFTPEIVLCVQSSKGCYWGQCSFCDSDFGVAPDVKSLERLIKEIKFLRETYNIRNFEFIDEAIRPEYMKAMSERFIEEKLDIHWFSNGRLEDAFTPELLELLHRGGLTMLLWGLETGNERIMTLINKGINFEKRYDILKASADAGIWNFAYIFFGFPTETREEAMDTINSITEHTDIIHSYGRSVFSLGRHSRLWKEAKKFGISEMASDEQELSSDIKYKSSIGLTNQEVGEMINLCLRTCKIAYGTPLWMYLKYRENLHLYLANKGLEYLRDYPAGEWSNLKGVRVI